jgi:hypothetical protein
MKIITECHYCGSARVNEKSFIHQDKKLRVNGECFECMKTWTETWTLTKLEKYLVRKGEKVLEAKPETQS